VSLTSELGLSEIYGAFIDNTFQPVTGETFAAIHASTGESLANIARCGNAEVDAAVRAASRAFPAWKATSPEERSILLLKLADAVEADAGRLARIDSIDIGRRHFETALDHQFAISQYRYFAAAVITHEGFGRPIPNRVSDCQTRALRCVRRDYSVERARDHGGVQDRARSRSR